jgi:hypothetical protein
VVILAVGLMVMTSETSKPVAIVAVLFAIIWAVASLRVLADPLAKRPYMLAGIEPERLAGEQAPLGVEMLKLVAMAALARLRCAAGAPAIDS